MGGLAAAAARLRKGRPRHAGLEYLLSTAGGTSGSRSRDAAIKIVRAYERDRWRFSTRRFGAHVDRVPIDRPILLIGTQGAGETIVGRCLRRNRAVVSVSGNSDSWTGGDEMGTIRNRMSRLPRTLWGSKHRSDIPHPLLGTDQPFACDDVFNAYRKTAADASVEDARRLRRVLREHLCVYAHDPAAARFVDKTHAYTVKLPLLAALLEDASPRFVLVIRNPYETCRWMLSRKPTLFQPHVPASRRLEIIAEHWANAFSTALADAEEGLDVAVVRFEDFLADPESVVRALCDFVDLDFDEAMVPGPDQKRPFATLPGDRKWYPCYRSDWLTGMTQEEEHTISERCSALAGRFGYTSSGISATTRPLVEAAA